MYLSDLKLQNFRSYPQESIKLDPNVNLIIGPNGSGKTNILESIFFLASGKSFRSSSLSQLIHWDQPFTSVCGQVSINSDISNLEAQLIKSPLKSSLNRKFLIDGVVKTRPKYLGTLKTVIFEPEDIRLITGSPTRRRDFLDSIFTSTEWRYAQSLSQYHRALKHRNELLDLIRIGSATKSELFYWDQSLVKNASVIESYRQSFVRSVNQYFQNHSHSEIKSFSVVYHPSIVSVGTLEQNFQSELSSGFTSSGPHRSDYSINCTVFSTPDPNLAFWGSRGQQRLAVLALRLAQINYLEDTYQQPPILLLDDIFSELDPQHRYLVTEICRKYQTIFTSAEVETSRLLPQANLIKLPTA